MKWNNIKKANQACIEEVFFKSILLVALIGCTIALSMDVLQHGKFTIVIDLQIALIILVTVSLVFLKRISYHKVAAWCLIGMALIFGYRGIFIKGFFEITGLLIIALGFVASVTTSKWQRLLVQAILFITLLAMIFFSGNKATLLLSVRESVPYFFVLLVVTICGGQLKDRYEQNQQQLSKYIELLKIKNDKINAQHKNLEQIVKHKTAQIEKKNQHLFQLAFANAHQVRGPLARILGLLNLIGLDPLNKEFYLGKLQDQALEMDEIVCGIGRTIENNLIDVEKKVA